ncbi:MAG: excinuclease ABC subunit C [Terriglobales bacterium]
MLPRQLDFVPERDAEIFAAIPAAPAVFLLRGSDAGAEPYVSKTTNLRRRVMRLLAAPTETSRRLNLRERVAQIEWAPTGSDFESGFLLYKTLREVFPRNYQDRLRLRPAPLVRLHLENRFPRVSVTTHLSGTRSGSIFYGPFPSRAAAEKFANDALDFFKIRRCTEELHPDPSHPGCVYSEMKMCLAPCFQGCTDEQYASETARVVTFFDTSGESLARELAAERDRASAELQFEQAAAPHATIEKLKPVLAQAPEIVHRIENLSALMIQPSAETGAVTFFRIEGGCISEPIQFPIVLDPPSANQKSEIGNQKSQSMERRILDTLASAPAPAGHTQPETEEHLSIVKRWYYRSLKVGEIFFADARGELPMRRVVRGVSRVFKGEKPSGDLSETARDYWVNRGKASEMGTEH